MSRLLVGGVALAGVLAGCGGASRAPSFHAGSPAGSRAPGTDPTATAVAGPATYCGSADIPIPGAAAALAGEGPPPTNLTAVEEAWYGMRASMVPACSEITPDPPPVVTTNLTQGRLSDSALQTWVGYFQRTLALEEWAQQHNQPDLLQYLGVGSQALNFVRAGGRIVDSPRCEYPTRVDAVSITGQQMSELTSGNLSSPGIAYLGAALGPCTSKWTSSTGNETEDDLQAGQEGREVDLGETRQNPAVGRFIVFVARWTTGGNALADDLMRQVGI